ncbi:MAG TPA: biotin carboxylase N-terminal domain-containing protein [Mycobacteriales bacterium]
MRRVLVANRGEIARRVMRTCAALGIESVAVYAEGDSDAPFVADADRAVALGGRTAAETYLDIGKILDAAAVSGADAVHPGYGFLSENAGFARAVQDAGLVWVGPPADAIAAMGDKLAAKDLMAKAGVPTLPSARIGAGDEPDADVGFPVLVKASAGGGGKGMRVVHRPADLAEAVAAARREAVAAFGDGTVFLERYVTGSRHVEIQILGDTHGNVVHCFERECSIQRRHQKIIEEAPSPAVDDDLRARMGADAVSAARAIGYCNAGTVEFLLDADGSYYFLEVNTRLQVEHPVTEAITGLDLVREQLRIADGERLSFGQDDLAIDGHAIEVRVYAEDPAAGFLPATGRLVAWAPPVEPAVRVESGVAPGSVIGVQFDPLLAKVIAHAPTRAEAAGRLALALERTRIAGVTTNRDYLAGVLRHPDFLSGAATTAFVEQADVPGQRRPTPDELGDAAVAAALAGQQARRAAARTLATLPSGWRGTVMPPEHAVFVSGDEEITVAYRTTRDGTFDVAVAADRLRAKVIRCEAGSIDLEIGSRRLSYGVDTDGRTWWLHGPGGTIRLDEQERFPETRTEAVTGGLVAPMPGSVVSVHVAPGDAVEDGALLVVLEAMKMEHRVTAPHAGVVGDVHVSVGSQVAGGDLLVVLGEPS